MYTGIAVLITTAMVVLTVLGARCTEVRGIKRYILVNLGISVGAAILCALIPFLVRALIFGGENTSEWKGWAWDAFAVFLKTTLPVMGIGLLLIALTVVVNVSGSRKNSLFSALIRQSASVAFSVILLFLAPFYSAMAETGGAFLHVFILIFGIAEALLMRLTFALELAIKLKRKKKS